MKLAIIRTANGKLRTTHYNVQEIGLGSALLRKGVNVDFYSQFSDVSETTVFETYNDCKLNLVPISGLCLRQVTYYPSLVRELLSRKYDIVQVHEDSQLMTHIILKKLKNAGVKTILYQGMYENYTGIGRIYQNILNFYTTQTTQCYADIHLAKTSAAKRYLEKKGFEKVLVQPIGINLPNVEMDFDDRKKIQSFRDDFEFAFFYVGVFEPRRNVLFLLELLKEYLERHGKRRACLIAVGKGPDLQQFHKKVENLRLSDNVYHIDSVPNSQLASFYRMTDIFLLPSRYEIYGMVILESLFYGTPVMSTKNAGSMDIINNANFGLLVNLDVDLWCDQLQLYLNSSYSRDEKYRDIRKEYIVENYSWKVLAEKYFFML